MADAFREKLQKTDNFVLTFELVPGRAPLGRGIDKAIGFAQQAAEDGLLDALTITDNPGGNPALSPDVLGREIKQMGIEPVVHFACRDWNRYGAFSRVLQLRRLGIRNMLVVTGDYPIESGGGTAKPCFDLDSVTMTCMLNAMNRGAKTFCAMDLGETDEPTDFFPGVAVSCFKHSEAETLTQYYKLLGKVRNGAGFAITQICFDARKLHELAQFARLSGCDIPLIGSVHLLGAKAARFINRGRVPGAHVTDKLLERIRTESSEPDKGRSKALSRAAKLMAVLKGLGYSGAHISGSADYNEIRDIILRFRENQGKWRDFLPEFDYPFPDGFYLYQKDPDTQLNTLRPGPKAARRLGAMAGYRAMHAFHAAMFEKQRFYWKLLVGFARWVDRVRPAKAALCLVENTSKMLLFDCRRCGDCALPDMAYLCPESQCPKFLRNGPCGGSDSTRCEVHKDKTCVWVSVYRRLAACGEPAILTNGCVPPRNWALDRTSSWLNYYLGRDYQGLCGDCAERQAQSGG